MSNLVFNLGGKDIPSVSRAGQSTRLKANGIYDVAFDGAEATVIEGKDGTKYNVLRMKFVDDNGLTFEDTIFEPRHGDDVRQENSYGYANPSRVEEIVFKVKHLIRAVAPKVADQMEDKKIQFTSWEDLRQFVVKNTAKSVGTRTQIKLLADKNGNPQFPMYVLGISKTNEVYPKTNFIGANLAFTTKEKEKIDNAAEAKSTDMDKVTNASTGYDLSTLPTVQGSEDDLDLDLG